MTTSSGSSPESPARDQDTSGNGHSPRPEQNSQASAMVIFVAILGFMATVTSIIVAVFSWNLLKTGSTRGLSIAGLALFRQF